MPLLPIFTRAAAVLTVAALTTFTFCTSGFAQSTEVAEASLRINIAGRQRMLSQRMSKAACFAYMDVDAATHKAILNDAFELFTTSHNALRYGDNDIGLDPEKMLPAIEALALVDKRWASFSRRLKAATTGKQKNSDQIAALDTAGLLLLGDMNDAVYAIAAGYGNLLDDLPMIQSITIDVAGRQRMLTQKAAKEFCLIDSGIDVEVNRTRLAETITLFSNTLDALLNGMPGMVIAPPNDEILAKLHEVEANWTAPYAILSDISDGAQPCCDQPRDIGVQLELVLILMNQAVKMYETAP